LKKASEPFLLAHHPSCKNFEHHTIEFRGRKLCMGCFITYPSVALTLVFLYILNGLYALDHYFLLALALVLFGINLIRKMIFKDNFRKGIHVIFRAELGIMLALALMSIVLANGNERILIGVFAITVAIVYNLYNGWRNLRTCKTCPQYIVFPKCDGLAPPSDKR